jgi:hypothetical protein
MIIDWHSAGIVAPLRQPQLHFKPIIMHISERLTMTCTMLGNSLPDHHDCAS